MIIILSCLFVTSKFTTNFKCRHNRKLCFGKNKKFYDISLQELKKIYNEIYNEGVISFLSGGTLLGLVRENNLLRNDDDLNISFLIKNKDTFKIIEKIFKNYGYKTKKFNINIRGKKEIGQYTFSKIINNFPIEFDVVPIWKDIKNNKYIWMTFFKNIEFHVFEPFDLKEVIFLKNKYLVPRNLIKHIKDVFGPEWMTEKSNFKYTEYNNIKNSYETDNLTFSL